MRDLAARLREIVRTNPPAARPAGPAREVTYVAGIDDGLKVDRVADALGGVIHEADGGCCVVIERRWEADTWHGRRRIGSFVPRAEAPLSLYDRRLGAVGDWARRIVFFDIETTGLSGGAGTLAFLAGCGWFDGEDFVARQFFLHGPAGERAMLDALAGVFRDASLIVTYNGRTFDVPTMETRWAFHRQPSATDDLPHFDMLPAARRLWGRGGTGLERRSSSPVPFDTAPSCSLVSLERSLLGFHRVGDVPGFEIPARYFHFLRTGDPEAVSGVLEHNRLDLVSLAAVTSRALELVATGPVACRDEGEQLGLGRVYEQNAEVERAMEAYRLAGSTGGAIGIRVAALSRLAELLRRGGRHDEAAGAWRQVLDLSASRDRTMTRFERRAAEGLAIHLEHRAKDLDEARRYAEALQRGSDGRERVAADYRLGRLTRKTRAAESTTGGLPAAHLKFEP